jgi:hypothetical protein
MEKMEVKSLSKPEEERDRMPRLLEMSLWSSLTFKVWVKRGV